MAATTDTTNTTTTAKGIADWVANDAQGAVLSITRNEPSAHIHYHERMELREVTTRHQASRGDENLGMRTFMNDPSDERLADHDVESGEFGRDMQRDPQHQKRYSSGQHPHHYSQKDLEEGTSRDVLY